MLIFKMRKLIAFTLTILATIPAFAQEVDQEAYQRYINNELYNQMVPGFYQA